MAFSLTGKTMVIVLLTLCRFESCNADMKKETFRAYISWYESKNGECIQEYIGNSHWLYHLKGEFVAKKGHKLEVNDKLFKEYKEFLRKKEKNQ